MGVDRLILRERFADVLQLGFLGVAFHRHVAPLPGGLTLLQGGIVERAAAPQNDVELALLLRRRPQFLLVGLAYGLGHGYCSPFCCSTYSRSARTISPLSERSCCSASRRNRSAISAGMRMVILVGGRFSLMQPLYTNMVAQARAEASDFTFLLIPLVVLAILGAIPLLLLSACGAGPGLGNQPGVLGGALGPCPASPAVSHIESGDAGLYATAIDGVYRYSVQQGHLNLIWHAIFKPSPEAIMTQVVVVDDEAVSVQDSGSGLYVDALNTPNGRLRWRMPLGGGEVSNMLLADRTVFVESDGPGGGQFTIRAFNISSGSPRWSYTFTSNDEENEGGYFPGLGAVANGVVYSGAGDYLLALNASTGKMVWKVQFNSSEALLPPEIMGGVLFDELISTVGSTSAEIAFDPTT